MKSLTLYTSAFSVLFLSLASAPHAFADRKPLTPMASAVAADKPLAKRLSTKPKVSPVKSTSVKATLLASKKARVVKHYTPAKQPGPGMRQVNVDFSDNDRASHAYNQENVSQGLREARVVHTREQPVDVGGFIAIEEGQQIKGGSSPDIAAISN